MKRTIDHFLGRELKDIIGLEQEDLDASIKRSWTDRERKKKILLLLLGGKTREKKLKKRV